MAFTADLFAFLADLKENNDRGWFEANKKRYEASVKGPALAFIADFEPHLKAISPHFEAIAKASGGSLFRIFRDTRFSADKTPYKTTVGIQFRHEAGGRDAHAPGFYLHLEPGGCFGAVGIWHPDPPALKRIRDAIVARADAWTAVKTALPKGSAMMGDDDALKRVPAGYPKDHPHEGDLRRKSVGTYCPIAEKDVLSNDFPARFAAVCRGNAPVARFVCDALGQPF